MRRDQTGGGSNVAACSDDRLRSLLASRGVGSTNQGPRETLGCLRFSSTLRSESGPWVGHGRAAVFVKAFPTPASVRLLTPVFGRRPKTWFRTFAEAGRLVDPAAAPVSLVRRPRVFADQITAPHATVAIARFYLLFMALRKAGNASSQRVRISR